MRLYRDVITEATELHVAGKLAEAAYLYENLLGSQPGDSLLLYLYGSLCTQQKKFGTAIALLSKAVEIEPKELPEAWHNLGCAYRNEGHSELSRECYKNRLALEPGSADTLAMLAGSYVNQNNPSMAIDYADRALAITPDDPHARNHKALALLELGRYEEAWPYYATRYALTDSIQARPYTCKRWNGGKVGKLAVHGEQGLGDEIMFMSCFDELKDKADVVVVEAAGRLLKLFERTWPEVRFYATHEELIEMHPDVDAYLPMGGMPALCRNTSEDFPGHSYLVPDKNVIHEHHNKLKNHQWGVGPRIGIAWHGGTKATHQELRNPGLEHWQKLIDSTDAQFISVQYGPEAPAQAQELGIPHWQYAIDDLDSQAALIVALDLVITPCQTAVHIAGAVGTPCWCLTPEAPAWRYKVKGEMDWYNSVKLIRQKGKGWDQVFDTVKEELNANFGRISRAEPEAA